MNVVIEGRSPAVSVIVVMYNMAREAPRTLYSLSGAYQRGIESGDYEVIVIDNGSTPPLDARMLEGLQGDFRLLRIDAAKPSPVEAINRGIAEARGALVGVMIDGARLASPGMLALAARAARLSPRAAVLTLGFHLGPKVQMESVPEGYDSAREDRLLESARWTEDGYRLFDISVRAGSSAGGWFRPINESNALFLRREFWEELGGYDEKFQSPGGGLANLDMLCRAVSAADVIVTLLGEGTFHQVHGGVATNATRSPWEQFHAEYVRIRGHEFRPPEYQSFYLGAPPSGGSA